MDRMFGKNMIKKPTIGAVVSIDFDHKKTGLERKSQRWSSNSRENSSFLIKNKDDRWGFVINPNNIIRQAWDIVAVMSCLVYSALRVPYVIAFDIDELNQLDIWFILNRIVDLVFISDIIVIFLTAYQDGKHYVVAYNLIAWQYIKTWFLIDLCSSVPLDLIFWLFNPDSSGQAARSTKLFRVIKITRTLRILRIFKLQRVMLALEIFLNLNFSMMSIFKFFCGILLSAHLIACGFLFIGAGEEEGWISESNAGEVQGEQYGM